MPTTRCVYRIPGTLVEVVVEQLHFLLESSVHVRQVVRELVGKGCYFVQESRNVLNAT